MEWQEWNTGADRHRNVASNSVRRGNEEAHGKGKRVIKVKNRKRVSHGIEGITGEIRSMVKKYVRGHLDG